MIRRAADFLVNAMGWTVVTVFLVVPLTVVAIFVVLIILVTLVGVRLLRFLDPLR